MERELQLTRAVQKKALPILPASRFWDIAYACENGEVSRSLLDFYAFHDRTLSIMTTSGREHLGMVRLEVSGSGIAGALAGFIAKPIFYRCHRDGSDQKLVSVMTCVHDDLVHELGETGYSFTGISVRFLPRQVEFWNGSTPKILLLRAGKIFILPFIAFELGRPDSGRVPRGHHFTPQKDDILIIGLGMSDVIQLTSEKSNGGRKVGFGSPGDGSTRICQVLKSWKKERGTHFESLVVARYLGEARGFSS